MGVAPTLLEQQYVFDWDFAEAQFDEPVASYARPPESEIYGRSLGTIRRLGAFMLHASATEAILSPEAAQAKVEFYTSVEEGFGTDMELGGGLEVRDFDSRPIMHGRVMSKDLKTAISTMTEAGLACAVETAKHDRHFLPQLTRSERDHENALIVDKMARGETAYNTRIVISPFPEEGAAQSGNEYWRNIGYVPHLRRGFVQLYHVAGREVITGSLSFDGSDKRRLREIFRQFGVEIPQGEVTDNWLTYTLTDTLSTESAKALATTIADIAGDSRYAKHVNTVDVTRQYKSIMERAFNESYIHVCESLVRGYQTPGAKDLIYRLADKASHFNGRYARALYGMRANSHRFTADDSIVLHELLVYSTIEMMRALHLEKADQRSNGPRPQGGHLASARLQSLDPHSFQNALSSFGADGARHNRTYSACGLSISPGDSDADKSPQSAFGGYDRNIDEDTDTLGSRWFTCPKGHLNYRRVANKVEKNCRTCGTDVSCAPPKPEQLQKRRQVMEALLKELFSGPKRIDNGPDKKFSKRPGASRPGWPASN